MLYLDSQFESIQIQHNQIDQSGLGNEGEDEGSGSNNEEMESESNINEQLSSIQQSNDSNGSSSILNRMAGDTLGNITSDNTRTSASTTNTTNVTNSTTGEEFASALSHFKEPSVLQPVDLNANPIMENELMTDDERDSNLSY
jgi:hypothetical protein